MALFFRAQPRMFFLILRGPRGGEKNCAAFGTDLREFSRGTGWSGAACTAWRRHCRSRRRQEAGMAAAARRAAGRGPCGAGFGRSRRHPHRWRAQRFECRGRRDVHIAARRPPSPFGCTAFRVVFARRPDDAHRCNSQRCEWSPQQDIHIGIGRFLRSRVRSPCKCTGVRVIGEAGYPHRKPASFIECGWHLMDNARRGGR